MNNIDENLIRVIDFWRKSVGSGRLFSRSAEKEIDLKSDEIISIIGPRRSGKSSVLKLIINKLPQGSWMYINFEDPFFIEHRQPEIVEQLIEVYLNNYGLGLKYLFFDEIQNIDRWENVVRKYHEAKKYKIFVTGSSSKLLSKEFSTVLTGRHKLIKVLPLSFGEFLNFQHFTITMKADYVTKKREIEKYFRQYLTLGGFPKVVLEKNPEVLKQYFYDIIQKDIAARYGIRQQTKLERLGVYLLSNVANVYSVSALSKTFDLSWEYITLYVDYFKEAFLVDELKQFSYSLKTQEKAFNKVYAIDNGLVSAVSFAFSDNFGRALENCAYNFFANNFSEVYYYKTKEGREVDFVVKGARGISALVQVCAEVVSSETRERETRVLIMAGQDLKCPKLVVATLDYENEEVIDGAKISFVPLYKILLGLYVL